MKNHSVTVPVESAVQGRILDSNAEPLDNGPQPQGLRVPRLHPDALPQAAEKGNRIYETGIKPFDLFAPVPQNGIVSIVSEWGVGTLVLLYELMRIMNIKKGGKSVIVTYEGGIAESQESQSVYREVGVLDSLTGFLVPYQASADQCRNALLNGLTVARHILEVEKRNLLLVVDRLTLDSETVGMLRRIAVGCAGKVLTVVTGFHADEATSERPLVEVDADVELVFSRDLASRGLYPAIDPLKSCSHLLTAEVAGNEHYTIVQEIQEILRQACSAEEEGDTGGVSEHDSIDRARRIERYMTQPFYTMQLFNGMPGESVPLEQALRDCRRLLSGDPDDLSLEQLTYIGSLEGALGTVS